MPHKAAFKGSQEGFLFKDFKGFYELGYLKGFFYEVIAKVWGLRLCEKKYVKYVLRP